jgi:hypothetical protein
MINYVLRYRCRHPGLHRTLGQRGVALDVSSAIRKLTHYRLAAVLEKAREPV